MKWPWHRDGPDPEAIAAAEHMARQLIEAHDQSKRAEELGEELRQTAMRNHFGEAVTKAMMRRRHL